VKILKRFDMMDGSAMSTHMDMNMKFLVDT
jgi:hypothetical protein